MAERIDGIDVGYVLETVNSPGYRLIVERMKAISDSKLKELRDATLTHDQTQAIRGLLDGIDRCLAVPQQLRDEFESGRKGRK